MEYATTPYCTPTAPFRWPAARRDVALTTPILLPMPRSLSAPLSPLLLAFALTTAACSDAPTDPDPEMELTPAQADLDVGETLSISAALMGLSTSELTWESDCGRLDAAGTVALLTARWAPADCTVTARSVADPTISATTEIRIHPVSAADNLLAPGTFDRGLAPFSPVSGQEAQARWSDDDARGAPGSGSARISHPFDGDGGTLAVMDFCFTPEPGATYRLGGQARLLHDEPGAQVLISARVFSNDCVLFEEYLGHGTFAAGSVEWETGAFTFRAPAGGTDPVRITVGIHKAEGLDTDVAALVDDLFLVRIE